MKLLGARRSSLSGETFDTEYVSVILPDGLNEQLRQNGGQCQDIEVSSFLQNPYSWGIGGDKVRSS